MKSGAVWALVVATGFLGGCRTSPSSQTKDDGSDTTFPADAFSEPGPSDVLRPSTSSTSVDPDESAGCPGAVTCRLNAPGEPLDLVGGKVLVQYRINPRGAGSASLTEAQVVAAIRAAGREWAGHDSRIELVYRGTTRAPAGTAGVFAFGSACGHGGFPACTDRRTKQPSVTFSSAAPWTWRSCGPGGDGSSCTPYPQRCTATGSTQTCAGIDLQAVATHEWGHLLGLEDLLSPKAEGLTMYARAQVTDVLGAQVRRDLSTIGLGDLVGLRRLYPGPTTDSPILTP